MRSNDDVFTCIDRGKQRTIALFPGWATDKEIFAGLDIDYNFIFPNLSDPGTLIKTFPLFLEKNGIEKISLLGWSLGGVIAADIAGKIPEKIKELILVGVRQAYTKEWIGRVKEYIKKSKKAYLYKFFLECFSAGDKDALEKFKEGLMKKYFVKFTADELCKGLDYLYQKPIVPDSITQIKKRFIFGKEDKIVPVEEIIKLKQLFPESRFVFIEKAGHMPFLNKKTGFALDA
ncbi:MAG: alpha/beta fold hydrolase [Candidatus Saganbacteria bacterium]|nr:alpha/beta fold hydrolase [Candidatus Saganbacteria bacterium]